MLIAIPAAAAGGALLWPWGAVICVVAASVAAAFAFDALCRKASHKKYPPEGRFVLVDGRKMHLTVQGTGDRTIIFLPGLGTACPSIDFLPLIRQLKDGYRCVVVEPFGYGYADGTFRPRTARNIVSEIRQALAAGGFTPPFTLLGHSISGIYMLHWAAMYPEEIEAVIGDDTSVPNQVDIPGMAAERRVPLIVPVLNRLGVHRLLFKFGWRRKKLLAMCGGEHHRLPAVRALASNHYIGRSLYDEGRRIAENFSSAKGLRFPYDCRLLMLVAQKTVEMASGKGFDWLNEHGRQALEVRDGRCVLLDGPHYLHWSRSVEMAREIRAFLGPAPVEVMARPSTGSAGT